MNFTIDKEFEIPSFSPVCSRCVHLLDVGKRSCKAFDNIPMEIWKGFDKHDSVLSNQKGVFVFEKGIPDKYK